MRRVAIHTNTSWNIYNFRKGILLYLMDRGYKISAIAPEDDYSQELEKLGCDYHPIKIDNKGVNPAKDMAYMRNLYKVFRAVKPDIILQYTIKPNIYGTLVSRTLGIPVINNVSGLGTAFIHDNLTSKIAQNLYKFAFKFPKKVFFQNKNDQLLFLDKNLVNQEITSLLPGSGVNLDLFDVRPIPHNNRMIFLMIARLIYDKGVIEYIEAIRLLRAKGVDAEFQIIGKIEDNPQNPLNIGKAKVDQWVSEGLLNYLGTTDDIPSFIEKADCVVLPSYREGTPRSLLEAASMGRPLIATNVVGCIEVVEDQYNGLLCEVKDPKDLAQKMLTMYQMPKDQREEMGQKGREKMERQFDEKIVIGHYYDTIVEILS